MGPEIIVPVAGIICLFGLPIWSHHQQKMMELKLKLTQKAGDNVASELQAIRQEMAELRDTTTRYDMSFNSALQRIESRVGHLEGRVTNMDANTAQTTRGIR